MYFTIVILNTILSLSFVSANTNTNKLNPFSKTHFRNHICLTLPPIKFSKGSQELNLELSKELSCFYFKTKFEGGDPNEVIVSIKVEDIIPEGIGDPKRFGGTSVDKGKQKLFFNLRSMDNDFSLLKSSRNLKTGISMFEVNPMGMDTFEFCFQNFVFDGSWDSIDSDKTIEIDISANDLENPALEKFITSHFTEQIYTSLQENVDQLNDLLNVTIKHELLSVEGCHRDLNENTFSLMIKGGIFLTVIVCLMGLFQLYLIFEKMGCAINK
ncbi:Rrt6p NDAI_0H03340 [Naumovozyma dairenensis CBS 421]|uniref:GOLD domain-containing protein n=1 Tax=Naumovozyma dairenensis (strain ATCC 10597 / BCRC 20456 / CBS 421 / NBRC 0211 / NRRL Y-12639) TaxID=1071378 RepID=G0WFE6_NAUDC|nr:hypothetical protein NDAI_0H03340 [Naumovozyma dairenensis CBS 421]CCD26507.1 hypothetical protein NDAI_0H03340 [Naumovozyma dairenensis CBS 421]